MSKQITNAELINAIMQGASYSDRIPQATQTNLSDVADAILTYQPAKNDVLTALYNKIALTIINSMEFENPFARFRRADINYGDTLEDIFVDLPEGYEYNATDTNPFAQTTPDVKALYHTINKQLQYEQTIWDAEFRRALRSPYGLDSLVTRIVNTLNVASRVDDFLIAKEVLSQESSMGKVVYLGAETGVAATDGKTLLDAIKNASAGMKFPSRQFNQQGVMNDTPMDRQVLVINSKYKNIVDLDVLAGVYNLDKVDFKTQIIEIDGFAEDDIVAVLMDEKFLNFHYALQDGGLIYNPKALATNHFWNSWSINTVSLFQNAVMFRFHDLIKLTITAGTHGSVTPTTLDVPKGSIPDVDGNEITIGKHTITATADSGYKFGSWSGVTDGTAINSNTTITASFVSA